MKKTSILILLLFTITSCKNNQITSFNNYTENEYCFTNTKSINTSPFPIIGQTKSTIAYYKNTKDQYKKTQNEIFPFGTNLIYSLYSNKQLKSVNDIYSIEKIIGPTTHRLHKLLDDNYYYFDDCGKLINNLKVINDSYGLDKWIEIDKDIFSILQTSLKLSKISQGKFNMFIGELSKYWNNYININFNSPYTKTFDPDQDSLTQNKILNEIKGINKRKFISIFLQENSKEKLNKLTIDTPQKEDSDNILEFDTFSSKIKFKNLKKQAMFQ